MLSNSGITLSDITIVELPPPEMPSALASGQIDAYCVAEPFGARAVSLGVGKTLYNSTDLWKHSLCCALVLSDRIIADRRELAEKFVTLYHKSGKYISENKDKVYEFTQKYLNIDKTTYDISMCWIAFDDLTITREYYENLVKRVKEAGLSDSPPSFDDFVYPLINFER
jgi:NitT/TauT family transport system substrate-binding protein